jgi:hypothetical protein
VATHLSRGANAVKELAKQQRIREQYGKHNQEMRWLAENGYRFTGQWIALQGESLLAAGATAKEVFSRVADLPVTPLVIRINNDELPFAGW